jgi:hypothetical protein
MKLSAKVKSRLGINMTNVNNNYNQNQVREGLVHHGKCHQQLSAVETKDCRNHKKCNHRGKNHL